MQFPLLGLARDFHPLDNAHAERTKEVPFMMSYEWHFFIYLQLKVHRELCRIRDEQKTFGKIHVNTEL